VRNAGSLGLERAPEFFSPPTNGGAKANRPEPDDESFSLLPPRVILRRFMPTRIVQRLSVEKRGTAKAERTARIEFPPKAVPELCIFAMDPKLSVITCAHNPRPDYLGKVIEALERQTLAKERWQCIC